jgi:hypothetical protein
MSFVFRQFVQRQKVVSTFGLLLPPVAEWPSQKNSAIALICSRADDTTEGEPNLGGKACGRRRRVELAT